MKAEPVNLMCKECQKSFTLIKKEYTRQIKRGRSHDNFFCSLSCVGTYTGRNMTPETRKKVGQIRSQLNILHNKENKWGKKPYSEYRYYVNKAIWRKQECNIDGEYLDAVWKEQNGLCALTNIPITLRALRGTIKTKPTTASLDRKDSTLGYVKGNVQFVAYSINLAKNSFSDNEIQDFISLIRKS